MFTKKITKVLEVKDGDETGTVTIRKLSARSLDKCREQKQISVARLTASMGSEMIKAFRDSSNRAERPVADPDEVRYGSYDRNAVLEKGIVSWTFDVPLEEGIEDLDEPTSEFLFKEIVDLSDPLSEEKKVEEKKV